MVRISNFLTVLWVGLSPVFVKLEKILSNFGANYKSELEYDTVNYTNLTKRLLNDYPVLKRIVNEKDFSNLSIDLLAILKQ